MTPPERDRTDAVGLIVAERARQKAVEGWTDDHDDEHDDNSLAIVAALYALPPATRRQKVLDETLAHALWPSSWHWYWWKPKPRNRVRELVKAGALIVAEIERLQRRATEAPSV